jgi:hypothetical protein
MAAPRRCWYSSSSPSGAEWPLGLRERRLARIEHGPRARGELAQPHCGIDRDRWCLLIKVSANLAVGVCRPSTAFRRGHQSRRCWSRWSRIDCVIPRRASSSTSMHGRRAGRSRGAVRRSPVHDVHQRGRDGEQMVEPFARAHVGRLGLRCPHKRARFGRGSHVRGEMSGFEPAVIPWPRPTGLPDPGSGVTGVYLANRRALPLNNISRWSSCSVAKASSAAAESGSPEWPDLRGAAIWINTPFCRRYRPGISANIKRLPRHLALADNQCKSRRHRGAPPLRVRSSPRRRSSNSSRARPSTDPMSRCKRLSRRRLPPLAV